MSCGPTIRENLALWLVIMLVGRPADERGREVRLETLDHLQKVVIESDKLPDMIASARALVEGRNEKAVWLVTGLNARANPSDRPSREACGMLDANWDSQ